MKRIKKLKLTQLSEVELEKKELNKLRGGNCCGCENIGAISGNWTNDYLPDSGGAGVGSYGG
ncbi:MAG: TIGR04149 family rSAM-modified RiPP [Bacteroidales bacterium]|nr:TIGR04149 family rSAM-modified RiPP [Bacteroidales bacterium]